MWVSDKTIIKLSQALQVEVYQLLFPNQLLTVTGETELDSFTPSPAETLLLLQENIKRSIDIQFDRVLKSDFVK